MSWNSYIVIPYPENAVHEDTFCREGIFQAGDNAEIVYLEQIACKTMTSLRMV